MDCSPPGSSVHGISQVRLLECIAISLSRGSSQPRDQTCISCIGKRILYHWAMGEAQYLESYNVIPWFPPSIYTFPSHYLLRKLTNTHKPSASILRLQAFQGSFSANQNPLFFLRIPYILPWLPVLNSIWQWELSFFLCCISYTGPFFLSLPTPLLVLP